MKRRCCVVFKSGKRCSREAQGSWCSKHQPIMERVQREHVEILRNEARRSELAHDADEEGEERS